MTVRAPWCDAPSALPVPPWMTRHGETRVVCFIDMDETSYGAECRRHYTKSGLIFATEDKAARWQCPQCKAEARAHERATRDD